MIRIRGHRNTNIVSVILVAVFLLDGCSIKSVKNEDAGSSYVSVLSVASWEKYKEDLMPNFQIDSKTALDQVVTTTGMMENKIFDAMGGSINLAFSANAVATSSEKSDKGSAEVDKNTGKNIEMTQPKALSELKPEVDPMLRYLAATALYQEIKLLNKYLEDAACQQFTPYVVRLQVTVMPRVRKVPYDFYINLSFFQTAKKDKDGVDKKTPKILPLLVTDNLESILHAKNTDQIRQITAYLSLIYQGLGFGDDFNKKYEEIQNLFGKDLNSILTVARVSDNTIRVRIGALKQVGTEYSMIPRTHNITFLLLSQESAGIIELLSNSSMIHVENGKELRVRTFEEYNELVDEGISGYYENLLKAKDKIKNIGSKEIDSIKTKFQFEVETSDIEELGKTVDVLEKCYRDYKELPNCRLYDKHKRFLHKVVTKLLDYIDQNDMDSFSKFAAYWFQFPDPQSFNQLWAELTSSVIVGSSYHITNFTLPKIEDPKIFSQNALLLDDDEKSSTVLLQGDNLRAKQIVATLYIDKVGQASAEDVTNENDGRCNQAERMKKYPFVAQKINVTQNGNNLELAFPSIEALNTDKKADTVSCASIPQANKPDTELTTVSSKKNHMLEIKLMNDRMSKTPYQCISNVRVLHKKKEKPNPGYTITVPSSYIIANNSGNGSVQLIFKKSDKDPATKIYYEIKGAEIVRGKSVFNPFELNATLPASAEKPIKDEKGDYVNKNGALTLYLENLTEKAEVIVSSYSICNNLKVEAEPIKILVEKAKDTKEIGKESKKD